MKKITFEIPELYLIEKTKKKKSSSIKKLLTPLHKTLNKNGRINN